MPVTWTLDPASRLIRVRYTEPYTFEEWRTVVEELIANPAYLFHRQIGALLDRTEVGPPAETFTQAVAAYLALHPVVIRGRRIVFVVRDTESAAVAWQQARMCELAGAISTVFRSKHDAEEWLGGS